jgi:sterol desaturase/sphingolipid hydroxylase (fatty acid hydroxylase superfamily)
VTHYKGNFGNLLFLWDMLFGTAKITRRYPAAIGIENLAPISAGAQLLWPLIRR